jgi:acetyl esterase/lipase
MPSLLTAAREACYASQIQLLSTDNNRSAAMIVRAFAIGGLVIFACSSLLAADRPVIDVWPGKAPGETKEIGREEARPPQPKQKADVTRLTDISKPTLTLYQPPEGKRNGAAVIICPGGGYSILAWDLEGTEVAEWLNTVGVTALVLKYRVPRRDGDTANTLPLMDAQRAMSLVRSKASELGIDTKRIGILGFSAGGNLAAGACLKFEKRQYDKIDAVDDTASRPDFGVLVYPAYLVDNSGTLKPEYQPTKETPPMFFAHALNDGVTPESSIALTRALKAVGGSAELHVYESGGHGFGLRKSEFPCHTWPARCAEWMERRGLLK